MTTIKIGSLHIPSENIEYINEGDGTAYGRPYILMKSGKRITIESYQESEQAIKQLNSE